MNPFKKIRRIISDDWENVDIYYVYSVMTPYTYDHIKEFVKQMSVVTIYSESEVLSWLPYLCHLGINDLGSVLVLSKKGWINLVYLNNEAQYYRKF